MATSLLITHIDHGILAVLTKLTALVLPFHSILRYDFSYHYHQHNHGLRIQLRRGLKRHCYV